MRISKKHFKEYILIASVIYVLGFLSSITNKETVYAYEPKFDRMFALEMIPNFNSCSNWDLFLPFRSCDTTQIAASQYLWKLSSKLSAVQENNDLQKKPSEFLKKSREKVDALRKKISEKDYSQSAEELDRGYSTIWQIDFLPAMNLKVQEVLPLGLTGMISQSDHSFENDIKPITLIISKSRIADLKPEVEVIENAVVFRKEAATQLRRLIDPSGTFVDLN